jgi:hypothetical protein
MRGPRTVHCYEYVRRPYESVSALLHGDPMKLLHTATTSATARSSSLITLRVQVATVEIGVDVRVLMRGIRDWRGGAGNEPITRLEFFWEAARMPSLFPTMLGEVSAQPLSAAETQLEVEGSYWPPLGFVGNALDATVGHRIAEATVHRFLVDVVGQMRRELPTSAARRRFGQM